ncbi:MAG: hypothetical protein QW286_03265 [Candidatus Aenigmatarchaeota archaeon]
MLKINILYFTSLKRRNAHIMTKTKKLTKTDIKPQPGIMQNVHITRLTKKYETNERRAAMLKR